MTYFVKSLVLLAVFAFNLETQAQGKFYLKAPQNTSTGQQIKVSYMLENVNGSNFQYPRTFEGFQVLSGPNQSSNFQWVNGKTTQSLEYYFILTPTEVGEFTIPAASIVVNGQTYQTNTQKISVKQGSQTTQQQNQAQKPNNQQQQTSNDWQKEAKENIFVRLYVDKNNPYVGEQVTVYAKVYQRIQSYNTQITKAPEFNGFWKHDYDMNSSQWQDEEFNGKYFKTLLIGKVALFPQREGEFTVSPFELRTILRIQENTAPQNPWDWFFRMQQFKEVEHVFSSSSLKINVKPLPLAGKPTNFSGAVGSYSFEWLLDSTSLEVGNAATLKTKLTGTGNIMMVETPFINFPKGLNVFDPQTQQNISKSAQPIGGNIKADYLIVPEIPGEYELKPVEFSFFDIKSQSYKTVTSPPINLMVKGEIPQKVVETEEDSLENFSEIKFIALENDLTKNEDALLTSVQYWSVVAGAPLFLFLFLLVRKKQEEKNSDLVGIRSAKAIKLAKKRMEKAETYLVKNDKVGFYDETVKALWKYLSDKLNIDPSKLNREFVFDALSKKQVSEETIQKFSTLIDKSEMALYSPIASAEMEQDLNNAKSIIIEIEHEIG